MKSFTFCRGPRPTGRASIGYPYASVDIKLDKKKVGYIQPPNWLSEDGLWHIRLMVTKSDILEDGNPNCSWKWITLRGGTSDELEARKFLIENAQKIQKKFNLHLEE